MDPETSHYHACTIDDPLAQAYYKTVCIPKTGHGTILHLPPGSQRLAASIIEQLETAGAEGKHEVYVEPGE
jgi:hypothetical protein